MANYAYLLEVGRKDIIALKTVLDSMTDAQLRKVSSFFNLKVKSRKRVIAETLHLVLFLTHKDEVR